MAMDDFPPRRTWRCPDEMELAGFVERRLPADSRTPLEKHIAGCDFCLDQMGVLMRLESGEAPNAPPELIAKARRLAASYERSAWALWRWGAAAAAVSALALVLTISMRPPAGITPGVEAFRTAPATMNPPELLAPREGAVVARNELEFRWRPLETSLYYDVRVLTAEGDVVWEGRVNGNEARLPASIRPAAGRRYFVSVEGWLPEGKGMKSRVVAFQLRDQ